jgi:uracil-DNA glycosylase
MSYPVGLAEIYEDYAADPRFNHMRKTNIKLVGGHGPLNPLLMLIGEAPGEMENATAIPFLGPAGVALNRLLEDEGIDRNATFLTNTVKYRPVNEFSTGRGDIIYKNRTPTFDEISASRDYIKREIEVVQPLIIGLCGRVALQCFYPEYKVITQVQGQLLDDMFVPLLHPAVVNYSPDRKNEVRQGYHKLANYMYMKSQKQLYG